MSDRSTRYKKKRSGCCLWGILAAVACAAAVFFLPSVIETGWPLVRQKVIRLGLAKSPYYQDGDTTWDHGGVEEYYFNQLPSGLNEIYRELYSRISDGEDSADLYEHVATEDFWTAYYAVMADHPEFFWVGTQMQVQEAVWTGEVVSYSLTSVTEPEDRDSLRTQIEAAADQCLQGLTDDMTDYDKIRYVYEYIIDTTEYDTQAEDNQNIQSVLLGHRSVCAGYSRAFQYILHRAGLFCTYVTGHTLSGADHAWNIVRIGDQYYHVDATWGDPVFVGDLEGTQPPVMNYNYLCCTDDVIYETHIPDTSVALPACTDSSYDYYRMNGMYYETFDTETIRQALLENVQSGASEITMKFGSAQAYEQAKSALFDDGLVRTATQYLMDVNGVTYWNYSYQTDETFCIITLFWYTQDS